MLEDVTNGNAEEMLLDLNCGEPYASMQRTFWSYTEGDVSDNQDTADAALTKAADMWDGEVRCYHYFPLGDSEQNWCERGYTVENFLLMYLGQIEDLAWDCAVEICSPGAFLAVGEKSAKRVTIMCVPDQEPIFDEYPFNRDVAKEINYLIPGEDIFNGCPVLSLLSLLTFVLAEF
eukprot:Trichotokara_eunicae@DN97_c0_g1_i1.p1